MILVDDVLHAGLSRGHDTTIDPSAWDTATFPDPSSERGQNERLAPLDTIVHEANNVAYPPWIGMTRFMEHRQTGFRRDGRSAHRWQEWVRANRKLIDELALPADVIKTRGDFDYLLLHGYNRAGWAKEQPRFEVFDPSDPRHRRFWALLESYIAAFYPDDITGARQMLATRFGPPDDGPGAPQTC